MNILLVNYHSDRNAGDKVLLAVTLQQLRQRFPQAQITVATNDPATYQGADPCVGSFSTWIKQTDVHGDGWRIGGLLTLPVWGLVTILAALAYRLGLRPKSRSEHAHPSTKSHWALLRSYTEADLIVSCAGNFLYSSGSVGMPFLLAVLSLGYGILLDKPVYTMPQTIGPLSRSWERKLLAWVLPHLRLILVRDRISLDLVHSLTTGKGNNCQLSPDIAFAFQGIDAEQGRRFLIKMGLPPDNDRPLLGLTAINWGAQDRTFAGQEAYEKALAAAADHFIRVQGGRIVLFAQVCGPTASEDDRIPARRIHALIPHDPGEAILVDELVPAEMLQAAYANMDLFLGSRLHSNIFALVAGVPVVAVAYQYKTLGLMEMLGLKAWTLAIEESTPQTLTDLLERLWEQRQPVATHIAQRTSEIRQEIDQAINLIAQDVQSR